jgi:hypothetical protein
VFRFEQTHLDNASEISGLNSIVRPEEHAVTKNNKFKDYARYAEHCLNLIMSHTSLCPRLLCASSCLFGGIRSIWRSARH